ncbi:MAG TPA: hypothetical protein VJS44_15245 [Pyrinomonadaceae bacterium]|nr:hypothetical protein [Pyrinomonadaceae bacterium]
MHSPTDGIPVCSSYDNCPSLQYSSPTKLAGPLIYSFDFDQNLLNVLGSQQAVDDFKDRARAAARAWSAATGISITEVTWGQTVNVSIGASRDAGVRDALGVASAARSCTFAHSYSSYWRRWWRR